MNGVLIINKPLNYTSQDVVLKVKKILNVKKAGHTGTLDPMATGVLPILLGEYTKISKYLIEHDKKYVAKIKLGEKRDTGDCEGNVIEERIVKHIDENSVKDVLKSFLGKSKQIPPMYSAIKINGKKLYEYAREGTKIEVKPRDIEIYDINLISISNEFEIEFEVSCSKGTYIRVLCENIAEKLDNIGYMSSLKRIEVNKFKIEGAIDFETLESNKNNKEFFNNNILKMEEIFELPKIILNNRKTELFLNGVKLTYNIKDGIYHVYNENKYLGLGVVKENLLKRDVII